MSDKQILDPYKTSFIPKIETLLLEMEDMDVANARQKMW